MNMPGFTAETSLYKTNGHYQTSRPAFTSVTTAICAFHPAAEVIEVFGCPPGSTMVGTPPDDWYCVPDPLTEPWVGGDQSPGGDGGGGDTERFGGPGKKRRKKPKRRPKRPEPEPGPEGFSRNCSNEQQKTEKYKQCISKWADDLMAGKSLEESHDAVCGKKPSDVLCCTGIGTDKWVCDGM